MAKRPAPGPDLDDVDADLRATPDEIEAALLDASHPGAGRPVIDERRDREPLALAPPLSDELDLHTFVPSECAGVVAEYVRAAQEAGLTAVRIIHGKGTGALRRTVHSVLDRHPAVHGYRLAGDRSGWGATTVELVRLTRNNP